jgi:hypothetical protein
MIKALGVIVFGLIACAAIFLGIERNQPIFWQMGGAILGVIVLMTLAVKLFPKQLDSEESGKEGMKVLKRAARKAMKEDFD